MNSDIRIIMFAFIFQHFHIFGMAVLTIVSITVALDLWKRNLIERMKKLDKRQVPKS